MLSHVVLFTPRPDLRPSDRQDLLDSLQRALSKIPSVRDIRIGVRVRHGAGYEAAAGAGEFLAMISFDDLAGLHEYLAHPAHDELAAAFARAQASALVYDFEIHDLADFLSNVVSSADQ